MKHRRVRRVLLAAAVALVAAAASFAQGSQTIPTPEQFFGFPMGAERKLASLDKIYEYFTLIGKASPRVVVQEIGRSTMGKPILTAFIAAPEILAKLSTYQQMQKKLLDPRVTSEQEAEALIREHKAILVIGTAQDSPEPSSHLMAIRLIHKLATETSPWIDNVLNNVIILMIPVEHPDGHQLIYDWYAKNLGTPYEGTELPVLYHKYIGGDNNRDNYMQTQVEMQHLNRLTFKEWVPDVYVNQHNMGSDQARIFVPPYKNPPNPNVDPLIFSEVNFYGQAMAAKLHEAGKVGVIWGEKFEGYRQGTQMRGPLWRHGIGLLVETAAAPWGIPIVQPMAGADQPSGRDSSAPADGRKVVRQPAPTDVQYRQNYLQPWRGGTWTLADSVDYQFISTLGLIEAVANNRETRKRNLYLLSKRTIERFKAGSPYAYLVPPEQRDLVAAAKLVQLLQAGGAEVHRASAPFTADGQSYPAGTYVALLAQPFGRWLKDVLEPQEYPDIRWPFATAPIDVPYDVSAWSLGMLMGVNTILVNKPFEAALTLLREDAMAAAGKVVGNGPTYVLSHEVNNSFVAMNRLLKEGAEVKWASDVISVNGKTYGPGAILVTRAKPATLTNIARDLKLDVHSTTQVLQARALTVRTPRLAVYEPWGGGEGAVDAGWLRWLLEQHEFPYTQARNADLKQPNLLERFDVIVLPEMSRRPAGKPSLSELIMQGRKATVFDLPDAQVRPEYAGGIGEEGVRNLQAFVREGGTLITLGNTALFAIEHLDVPFTNVVLGLDDDSFFAPGSLLQIAVDTHHPIGYGMPEEADAMFVYNGAYAPSSSLASMPTVVIARYPQRKLLRSGWIFGEEKLRGRAAVMEASVGKGRVIMHTFRVQFRGQTWSTFKLLFNSFFYGAVVAGTPASHHSESSLPE